MFQVGKSYGSKHFRIKCYSIAGKMGKKSPCNVGCHFIQSSFTFRSNNLMFMVVPACEFNLADPCFPYKAVNFTQKSYFNTPVTGKLHHPGLADISGKFSRK